MPRVAVSAEVAPGKVVEAARRLGSNIRTARKRRRLRQSELARRAGITVQTLRRVESGSLGSGIGAYLAALWAMGLESDIGALASPDTDVVGKTFEASRRGKRVRLEKGLDNDF